MAIGDDYTDYQNTDSRPPMDDSEGFIVMDSNAEGFSYSKRVLKTGGFHGGLGGIISAAWRVTVRDGSAPDAPLLFEQRVIYRVLEITGGIFIPQDDPNPDIPWEEVTSHTIIQTLILNGQPVPERQAWQFVDTPTPTKFSEFGISVFRPNSGWIDIDWRSPRYKLELSDGAVLRVEEDQWRAGTAIPISYYKTSIKPGGAMVDAVIDPYGAMWHASTKDGQVRVATGFGPYRDLRHVGYLTGAKEASINVDRSGALWLLVKETGGWFEYVCKDGGTTWTKVRQVWGDAEKMARTLITREGEHIAVALDGNNLVFKSASDENAITTKIATVAKRQPFTPAIDRHGVVYAVGEDGAEYSSATGGIGGDW